MAVGSVFLERVLSAEHAQHPHDQLAHVLARDAHLTLLQAQNVVGENQLLLRRQHRRLARVAGARALGDEGALVLVGAHLREPVEVRRRHGVLHHLLRVRGERQVVGGVGGGEALAEDELQVGVVAELLGGLGVVGDQDVVEGNVLVLLEEHHEGLVQLVLLLADGGALDVVEELAEELDQQRMLDSTMKRAKRGYWRFSLSSDSRQLTRLLSSEGFRRYELT